MNRNEYRRAFIMLRSAMPGYGGHVRLERRTLTGSMYFIITAPQGVGELSAALVGQRDGVYYAAPIGPLSRDRRGQLALAWTFDPRSIEGRPLEAYPWVAVAATGGPCVLALTGNVEGSRPMDVRALEAAVCARLAPAETPAADLPDPRPVPEPQPEPQPAADGETHSDVKIYTMTRARLRRAAERRAESSPPQTDPTPTQPEPTLTSPNPADPAQAPSEPAPAQSSPVPIGLACPTPDANPADTNPPQSDATPADPVPVSAAKRLGLDITVPWPGAAEPLRRLFATQAPAANAPDDGFTYVATPMPAGSGYPVSYAGLRVEDGRIAAVRHALPARRTPEPPAGLEPCTWLSGLGEEGFWITEES